MGFDENRFNCYVDEEFRCPICQDILESPITSLCEHVFCKTCIDEWLQRESSCPVDRKPLNSSQLCETSRFFRNFYLKLEIKCEYYLNGCEFVCKIEGIKELVLHQKSCKYNAIVKYNCDKGCEALLTINDEKNHNCVHYLKSIIDKQKQEIMKITGSESMNKELANDMKEIISTQDLEINTIKLKANMINELINFSHLCRKYFFVRMKSIKITSMKFSKISDKPIQNHDDLSLESVQSPQTFSGPLSPIIVDSSLLEIKTRDKSILHENSIHNEFEKFIKREFDSSEARVLVSSIEHKPMIDLFKNRRIIKTLRVEDAVISVDRSLFCSFDPYSDVSKSIENKIITPEIAVNILELLKDHLSKDSIVLDIWSRSGYLSICIAKMLGISGKVIAIDNEKKFIEKADETLRNNFPYLSNKVKFIVKDGQNGYPIKAPYDVINISEAMDEVPKSIPYQLKNGGRLIAPIGLKNFKQQLITIDRLEDGSFKRIVHKVYVSKNACFNNR